MPDPLGAHPAPGRKRVRKDTSAQDQLFHDIVALLQERYADLERDGVTEALISETLVNTGAEEDDSAARMVALAAVNNVLMAKEREAAAAEEVHIDVFTTDGHAEEYKASRVDVLKFIEAIASGKAGVISGDKYQDWYFPQHVVKVTATKPGGN
jgi:hypothetical protein